MKRKVREGASVVFPDSTNGERAFDLFATSLGPRALSVHVPFDADQATYVPLAIARACGPSPLHAVDSLMTRAAGTPEAVFDLLDGALGDRVLCVAGVDRLRVNDPELRELASARTAPLRRWLEVRARVTTSERRRAAPGLSPRTQRRWALDSLWQAVGRDADGLQLALAYGELTGRPPVLRPGRRFEEALVAELWRALPLSLRNAVAMLVAHKRAAPRADLARLGVLDGGVLDECVRLHLVDERLGRLYVPRLLAVAMPTLESPAAWGQRHRVWADAYALAFVEDDPALPASIAALEAVRLYAAIPDVARAAAHARHGCEVLLDAAVRRSKAGAWQDAVALYDAVLGLDSRSGALGPRAALDRHTRGYAVHYLHFNRYKVGAETVAETARGYEAAVALWPENALLWSRLIRALFVAEREDDAMDALARARAAVPAHPDKERILVTRTVDRLLRRDLLLPAAFVWGGSTSALDRVVGDDLHRRILRGVTALRLWAPGVPAVTCAAPYTFTLRSVPDGVACDFDGTSRSGRTLQEALRAAVFACVVKELIARWRRETGGLSILAARMRHEDWHAVVRLGPAAVPEILRAIERQPDHWHAALVRLTGHDPFTASERLSTTQMCTRWIAWGRGQGMRW